MADSVQNFGHQFSVKLVKIVGTPEVHNIVGPLDDHGLKLDLNRLKGEKNRRYKERLLDVFVNPGSATYRGLINSITRELGLSQFDAINIDTVRDSEGNFVATAPRIQVDSTEVILYSKWLNEEDFTVDRVIPFYNTIDQGFNLEQLVDAINTSPIFIAQVLPGVDATRRSVQLIRQDSTKIATSELVPPASLFKLANDNIIPETIFFSELDVFVSEVGLDTQVPFGDGNFHVDFDTGRVNVRGLPNGGGTVRYTYMDFPLNLRVSDVVIQTIFDEKVKKQLFEQVQLNTGEFVNGLPKPETTKIINELIAVRGVYWGK